MDSFRKIGLLECERLRCLSPEEDESLRDFSFLWALPPRVLELSTEAPFFAGPAFSMVSCSLNVIQYNS